MAVMTGSVLNNLSYEDLISWINVSSGGTADVQAWINEANKYGVSDIEAVEDLASSYMNFFKDGNGSYTITSFSDSAQVTSVNPIDSNVSTIARDTVQTPINRGIDSVTGKLNMSTYPASGSLGQRAGYVLGSVGSAVAAVSSGISLGKIIDSALYNLNPDFWDSNGMSSLNPETWSSITNGDDSLQAGLFNMIFGIDPETGKSQAYLDQNAFAYMAWYMAQQGVFSSGGIVEPTYTNTGTHVITGLLHSGATDYASAVDIINAFLSNANAYFASQNRLPFMADPTKYSIFYNIIDNTNNVVMISFQSAREGSTTGANVKVYVFTSLHVGSTVVLDNTYPAVRYNYNCSYSSTFGRFLIGDPSVSNVNIKPYIGEYVGTASVPSTYNMSTINASMSSAVDGIDNQESAILPDTTGWDTPQDTLNSLQQQYPDMWNDALVWDNVQPDGTNPQLTYVPVGFPNATSATDPHPTSTTQTQANPQVDPQIDTQALIDFFTSVAVQSPTSTTPQTPLENPVDTGSGDSPTPVAPTGSASALWSVYHPTQAQINSFGAWLWGSVFTTDIRKLFEDPIQGVIKLHKVFATPVDAGIGTIVVGTLDSNVSSATVTQQYVEIDCGSVDCHEDFGNVFDYQPYTEVSLYLPFIGIVPLDVNDVMRSTINVKYGVDVFTGACLAMVYVTRDANTVNMYQYAGVCSVEYPLSNVQASGMLSGLLATAGGIASVAVTGGMSLPAAGAIVGGALSGAKRTVGRSGGFSGNSGAMGIKKPYLIIQRPQTKVAQTFPRLEGYPTNYSIKLSSCSGHVVVSSVHVEGVGATKSELIEIEELLKSGVLV